MGIGACVIVLAVIAKKKWKIECVDVAILITKRYSINSMYTLEVIHNSHYVKKQLMQGLNILDDGVVDSIPTSRSLARELFGKI